MKAIFGHHRPDTELTDHPNHEAKAKQGVASARRIDHAQPNVAVQDLPIAIGLALLEESHEALVPGS